MSLLLLLRKWITPTPTLSPRRGRAAVVNLREALFDNPRTAHASGLRTATYEPNP